MGILGGAIIAYRLVGCRMKLSYYPETDSAYIDFNQGLSAETHVIVDGLNAELDSDGRLLGIEFERASKHLSPELLDAHGSQRKVRASRETLFKWPMRLTSVDGQRSLGLEAIVHTGTTYTIVPSQFLKELGVEPFDTMWLIREDGRAAKADLGEATATINGRSERTLVIFGEDVDQPLMGAYTLSGLRLAVDAVNQRLVPATNAWA